MLVLLGLSPANGMALSTHFDGGALTSDAGLLAVREVERRLDVAGRLAAGIDNPRDPARTLHSVADILRFRLLLIAVGYEDGIDANPLRGDQNSDEQTRADDTELWETTNCPIFNR